MFNKLKYCLFFSLILVHLLNFKIFSEEKRDIKISSFAENYNKANSFEDLWLEMQFNYNELNKKFSNDTVKDYEKYCSPFWKNDCLQIRNLILGISNIKFLDNYHIVQPMIRCYYNGFQKIEECFLENCLSDINKKKIKNYKDIDLTPKHSIKYNCSSTTLGHLFYVAKVLENINKKPEIIVEFGAGYGNLARIMKFINPSSTLILFDFPEILALQYLFLKYTLPSSKVIIHTDPIKENELEKDAIHLVPVYLMKECEIKADVFISNFGLTESPEYVQKMLIDKNFFNAELTYISGQLNGWKESGGHWESHENIVDFLRKMYTNVNCIPFHIFFENQMSFEVIAKN